MVAQRNATAAQKLLFVEGFPGITGGCSKLEEKCPAFINMAKGGIYSVTLTDLDTHPCPGGLIRRWFGIPRNRPIALPREIIFRIAVREVEAWIIADRHSWAEYIGIAAGHFADAPDELPDPKLHLLNVVRKKGRKKVHKDMLPRGTASIGPSYNEVLCNFVQRYWSPVRAAEHSPSLGRAINALSKV